MHLAVIWSRPVELRFTAVLLARQFSKALAVGSRQRVSLCRLGMAPKRKADQGESPEEQPKKPRAKAAKKTALTEPYSTDDGWTVIPPSLLVK